MLNNSLHWRIGLLRFGALCPRIVPEILAIKPFQFAAGYGDILRRNDGVPIEN
jgi:hypothetical protein